MRPMFLRDAGIFNGQSSEQGTLEWPLAERVSLCLPVLDEQCSGYLILISIRHGMQVGEVSDL